MKLLQFLFYPKIRELFIHSFIFGICISIYRIKNLNWREKILLSNLFHNPKIKYIILEFLAFQSFWFSCIGFRYYIEQKKEHLNKKQ